MEIGVARFHRKPQVKTPCGVCGNRIASRQRLGSTGWLARTECVVKNEQGRQLPWIHQRQDARYVVGCPSMGTVGMSLAASDFGGRGGRESR